MGFPSSPPDGDIYTNANGTRYEYDSTNNKWDVIGGAYSVSTITVETGNIDKLGQNLDAGGNNITNLAAASSNGEAVRYDEFNSHTSNTANPHSVVWEDINSASSALDMDNHTITEINDLQFHSLGGYTGRIRSYLSHMMYYAGAGGYDHKFYDLDGNWAEVFASNFDTQSNPIPETFSALYKLLKVKNKENGEIDKNSYPKDVLSRHEDESESPGISVGHRINYLIKANQELFNLLQGAKNEIDILKEKIKKLENNS